MNDLVKFDLDKMAALGQEEPEETIPGNVLSTANDVFSLGGQELDNVIEVYILIAGYKNQWFDRTYDPDKVFPPACYAVSLTAGVMNPADNVPVRQSESCGTWSSPACWANEYKSKGKAKACGNRRNLIVIPTDKVLPDYQLIQLGVPPTSLNAFRDYVLKATKYALPSGQVIKIPLWALKTEIRLRNKKQIYTFKGMMPEDERAIAHSRLEEAKALAMQPLDVSGYEPPEGQSAPTVSASGIQRFEQQSTGADDAEKIPF